MKVPIGEVIKKGSVMVYNVHFKFEHRTLWHTVDSIYNYMYFYIKYIWLIKYQIVMVHYAVILFHNRIWFLNLKI